MKRNSTVPHPLWAITSYFNPVGYRRRRMNFRAFRERLAVPLAAAELSLDGRFELESDDAEVVLQRSDGDVMWQKERLLNLALSVLPPTCKFVAWLDCDIVFERADWAEESIEALGRVPLVQPFSQDHHLHRDANLGDWEQNVEIGPRPSVAASFADGSLTTATFLSRESDLGMVSMGHAWAARRELIEKHGLYDARIVGGGDTAVISAGYGEQEQLARFHSMNEPQTAHYLRWAEPFHQDVRGAVACVPGQLLHLWHGSREGRCYLSRHVSLSGLGFDPNTDIVVGPAGCWRWATDRPVLHKWVHDYFVGRQEDGAISQGAA